MIRWFSNNVVSTLSLALLVVQAFLVGSFFNDSLLFHNKTQKLLKDSNRSLNLVSEILTSKSTSQILPLKKQEAFKILELSSNEKFCRIEGSKGMVISFSKTGELSLWMSENRPFKRGFDRVPLMLGSLFMYQNNLLFFVEPSRIEEASFSHRIEDLILDEKGALREFKVDGGWFSRGVCQKLLTT
jgi:hypothetical protein